MKDLDACSKVMMRLVGARVALTAFTNHLKYQCIAPGAAPRHDPGCPVRER